MSLRKFELELPAKEAAAVLHSALAERGMQPVLVDFAEITERGGSVPMEAYTLLFGSSKLFSMLLGKNIEVAIELPFRLCIVPVKEGCKVVVREAYSIFNDFSMEGREGVVNTVNRMIEDIIDTVRRR